MKETQQLIDYVRLYDMQDPKIQLKLAHSLQVGKLCEELAKRLGLETEDIALAKRIGLLHDIGRFPQVTRYHTFEDAKSEPHAQLGLKVLFEEGWIQKFRCDHTQEHLIRQAIRYHSDRTLPKTLDPRETMFCHIVRDCDKIDILRVHQQHPFTDYLNCTKEELSASLISDAVVDAFLQRTTVDFTKRKTPLDILLSHDAILFGLHYPQSKEMFIERRYCLFTALQGISFLEKDTRRKLSIIMRSCKEEGFLVKEIL